MVSSSFKRTRVSWLAAFLLSVTISGPMVLLVDGKKLVHPASSSSQRRNRVRRGQNYDVQNQQRRFLQKNNDDKERQGGGGGGKNNDNKNNDNKNNGGGGGGKNNGGGKNQQPLATPVPTRPPNTPYPITPYPTTNGPTPTPPPTLPPSIPPVIATAEQQEEQQEGKPAETTWMEGQQQEATATATTTSTNNNNNNNDNQVMTPPMSSTTTILTAEQLQDIQYFGGGQITLRFSLWFQDETSSTAAQVGSGSILLAVLQSLQEIMCRSDHEPALDLATLEWSTPVTENQQQLQQQQEEQRELCVVPLELGGTTVMRNANANGNNDEDTNAMQQGSILLQPPTTYVVDRTGSNTNLHWTTWRVTWDVLRLGTFYILQGLENMGANIQQNSNNNQNVVETWGEDEIYRAGINAMQGILELALEVSIRESSFDKSLVGSMVSVSQSNNGMVLSSVYGEEVETLEPKLEWLGLASFSSGPDVDNFVVPTSSLGSTPQEQQEQQQQQGDNNNNNNNAAVAEETTTSTTSDAAAASEEVVTEDDEWDDDRYSQTYGITEPLDPPFWHPLRIVGIIMFLMTTACLIGLSVMSKRRQKRREIERKEAKKGLLNNPKCVEDMLTISSKFDGTTTVSHNNNSSSSKSNKNTMSHDDDVGEVREVS